MAAVCHLHTDKRGNAVVVKLICPCCIASKGGKALAKRYSPETRRQWGKLGGRPSGKSSRK